jgi:hypothetical protein
MQLLNRVPKKQLFNVGTTGIFYELKDTIEAFFTL